ncbi:hypothetical protein CDV50_10315 [Haematobacter massiliensis]|uniref:hypothetical protein n=1 Tax=Haematobacter massiliensis TaxID=195105 RepID=UPI000B498D05|nr:hypothetical protein [Haematobacter massiliensis]OWJ71390.1 hypothetical protein CDV50_10315 [Haematobacter massiliensis]
MTDIIEISNAMLERRIAQARHEGDQVTTACSAYHGSLDAAMALHNALLPGWGYHCGAYGARVWRYPGDEWRPSERVDMELPDQPARAWLLAILRAYQAQEASHGEG